VSAMSEYLIACQNRLAYGTLNQSNVSKMTIVPNWEILPSGFAQVLESSKAWPRRDRD
jgi:hypothetical protein